ncbi:GlcG/HbpS family heme-binding protein [Microvirga makkahensis]|uniref:Heme-binding protein n=1 Tax=Microvirga makkahensis TaxID=1128670 RepID=A0A7X3MS31_9HYPH|nr:heme-binding protein [Microvirga makkahensis]MXQ12106.1 heme-binding protein [Microvirga makkahensis]
MLTLKAAQEIIHAALEEAARRRLKPLAVVVLDGRGSIKASAAQDGTSLLRDKVAHGKAFGALGLGLGSRAIFERAQEQPYFVSAVNAIAGGSLVPVPGGVLINGPSGETIGAVGISGDTSDNDEACAVLAIKSASFEPQVG